MQDQKSTQDSIFRSMGLPDKPVFLAPLAGVSDFPFRWTCYQKGADLCYVEMLSATALIHQSPRTYGMMRSHPLETKLGVQITSRCADEMGQAVALLDKMTFDTIDINMGCPVKKVVKVGCGSAILRDPERVYQTTLAARKATTKPLSVKIRLGWNADEISYREVLDAAEKAGADWLTVHGRTRADDYSVPVNLDAMADLKERASIPVVGNGNLFNHLDARMMLDHCKVDGLMVSRGALGNPWVFDEIKSGQSTNPELSEWLQTVVGHLRWQETIYGRSSASAVCMRKHLLWYAKGWPQVRKLRDAIVRCEDNRIAMGAIEEFAKQMEADGFTRRMAGGQDEDQQNRFRWDPKFEMDRKLDRGVGDDGLVNAAASN